MTTAAEVAAVVALIDPYDALEREHRDDVLGWLASTDDVFRRTAPRTPPKHLVAYVVLLDHADRAVLLVDHRRSGLWLPAGGHVEPGEDPSSAARREAREELGLETVPVEEAGCPSFVTVTETVGPPEARHVDVSLWYLVRAQDDAAPRPDPRELAGVRWWTEDEVAASEPRRFDPHLGRFLAKVRLAGQLLPVRPTSGATT